MYSWSKDFPTLTELFFGKEEDTESIAVESKDTDRIIEDIPEVMTEELI